MRVLVIDDHALFAEGLTALLRSIGPDWTVEAFSDFEAAWGAAASAPYPDVVLLDFYMPGVDAAEAIRRLRTGFPSMRVAVVTSSLRHTDREIAEAAGANLFLTKHAPPEELAERLAELMARPQNATALVPPSTGQIDEVLQNAGLTARQMEVLAMVSEGLSNKAIARRLGVSPETVKTHISEMCRRLKVRNRAEAAHWGRRNGVC